MMIRNVLKAAVPVLFLLSCKNKGGNFTVEGSLQNVQGSQVKFYEVPVGAKEPVLKDSARLSASGSFSWQTKKPAEETMYYIISDKQGTIATVFTDASKVTIEADFSNQADPLKVTGSKASEKAAAFMKTIFGYLGTLSDWDRKNDSLLRDTKTSDSVKMNLLSERTAQVTALKSYAVSFIDSAKSPMLKIYAISNYQDLATNPQFAVFGLEGFEKEDIMKHVSDAVKQFPDHKGLAAYQKQLDESMHRKAPDFTLPDVNGQPVSLSSFKGKYVLVDFWASWCGPCRAENPNVVKAWQQFKNKNFTILGVSLDRPDGKADWLKAIKDDKLEWTHVSDLKYWESMVVPLYGINGIPYNVLVAPDGTIVAENLRGEKLEQKLAAVLK